MDQETSALRQDECYTIPSLRNLSPDDLICGIIHAYVRERFFGRSFAKFLSLLKTKLPDALGDMSEDDLEEYLFGLAVRLRVLMPIVVLGESTEYVIRRDRLGAYMDRYRSCAASDREQMERFFADLAALYREGVHREGILSA